MGCQLRAKGPRPGFAVCISILARTRRSGIPAQHVAISQAICLLPPGLLSRLLRSQRELTSSSALLGVCPQS